MGPRPAAHMAMIAPRVKPTVEVLSASDGRVYLLRGGRAADLALAEEGGRVRALLAALDGERTVPEAASHLRSGGVSIEDEELAGAVAQLEELGVLEDGAPDREWLSSSELVRFDRQLRYFGDVGECRARAQARLRDARVAVLGVGGLGGQAAVALAQCGVGRLVLVDHDLVETSNLSRQVLYGEEDLAKPKVQAAVRRLGGIDARLHVEGIDRLLRGPGDVAAVIHGADMVVAAVDWPVGQISRAVNEACFAAGVPYVSMSQHPPRARVGPTYLPGRTGCFACQEEDYRARFPLYDEYLAHAAEAASPASAFAPACGVIGSLVASEVVHHLAGLGPVATEGAAFTLDLRTLEGRWDRVEGRPGCPVCASVTRSSGGRR